MNFWRLILRNLWFHRAENATVLIGAAAATAVLVGALAAGDSVRASLRNLVLLRLGRVEHALETGDRYFRAGIAKDIASICDTQPRVDVQPALIVQGFVRTDGDAHLQAGNVQVCGITRQFWGLAAPDQTPPPEMMADQAIVNTTLARKLKIGQGSALILRFRNPASLPAEMTLSSDSGMLAARVNVRAVVNDDRGGRFSLRTEQVSKPQIFVPIEWLSERIGTGVSANVLLTTHVEKNASVPVDTMLGKAFGTMWTPEDLGLALSWTESLKVIEVSSRRVFIDAPVAKALTAGAPENTPVLTYLVNEICGNGKSVPYSFVSAPGLSVIPADLRDDETVINDWLADDLGVGAGDMIELKYYVMGIGRKFEERTSAFKVRSILPLAGRVYDRRLVPLIRGLTDVDNCRDWDADFPIDLGKVRKKDDEYWSSYRGTPKAFVTLGAAQGMWVNRYGSLTGVRIPFTPSADESTGAELEKAMARVVMRNLKPADVGIEFRDVKSEGLAASTGGPDFAGLFAGLSMFIVISAVMLTTLFFILVVERRAKEMGTLLALGFKRRHIRNMLFIEGLALAAIGGVAGCWCGVIYNEAIVLALDTIWSGAVAGARLDAWVEGKTLVVGWVAGVALAGAAIGAAAAHQSRKAVVALQKGGEGISAVTGARRWRAIVGGLLSMSSIVVVISKAASHGQPDPAWFFTAGAMMLGGMLLLFDALLVRMASGGSGTEVSLAGLALRNCGRRKGRSMAVAGLLACGLFVVMSVGGNRQMTLPDPSRRDAGTGGYRLIVETVVPVPYDLGTEFGRGKMRLDEKTFTGAHITSLRVHEGDDASCMNLNRAQRPTLLGVNPTDLAARNSFKFKAPKGTTWSRLESGGADAVIQTIADQNTIVWGLGRKIGDQMRYPDELGREMQMTIAGGMANSILAGKLVIAERDFIRMFPSESGYRAFLIDAPAQTSDKIAAEIGKSLRDHGVEITSAAERLQSFNVVENTYLSIFLVLGGLGVILGCVGTGVVAARNALERRAEMAALEALGFSRGDLRWMLVVEHCVLVGFGAFAGMAAAFVGLGAYAVQPDFLVPSLVVAALAVLTGVFWTAVAVFASTGRNLLAALREE